MKTDLPSVLLVDDLEANLLALEAVLAPLEARLCRARSGEEALRKLLLEEFACIVLDVQMPGLDGFETAQLIRQRERTRHVPIIFVTASEGRDAQVVRGFSEGAVDYLIKPYNPHILRAEVGAFVEMARRVGAARKLVDEARKRAQDAEARLAEERQVMLFRNEVERTRNTSAFMQAPFAAVVLRGPNLQVELVNAKAQWFFEGREVLGRPAAEAFSRLRQQGLLEALQRVYSSGQPLVATEALVAPLPASPNDPPLRQLRVVLQPMRKVDGTVDGILVCGFELFVDPHLFQFSAPPVPQVPAGDGRGEG